MELLFLINAIFEFKLEKLILRQRNLNIQILKTIQTDNFAKIEFLKKRAIVSKHYKIEKCYAKIRSFETYQSDITQKKNLEKTYE